MSTERRQAERELLVALDADGMPPSRRVLVLRRAAANRARRREGRPLLPELRAGTCKPCKGWGQVGASATRCPYCKGTGDRG